MNTAHSTPKAGMPFVCSWSGGKDSCLALDRAIRAGASPRFLLTMLQESGERSRSHGLARGVLQAQAAALGIPLVVRATSWPEYESTFVAALQDLKETGVKAGVFGDIDLEDHRLWEEKVCGAAGLEAYLPLWKTPRLELFDEFLLRGFEAVIVAVCEEKLDKAYLGRALNAELVREFDRLGIDPSGEEGEYHTVVTNGPIFSRPLRLKAGDEVFRSGYWFLDMSIALSFFATGHFLCESVFGHGFHGYHGFYSSFFRLGPKIVSGKHLTTSKQAVESIKTKQHPCSSV